MSILHRPAADRVYRLPRLWTMAAAGERKWTERYFAFRMPPESRNGGGVLSVAMTRSALQLEALFARQVSAIIRFTWTWKRIC